MLPDKTVQILWITFALVGLGTLLVLLCTLFWVKSLHARKNPFLVNLLLTTFLSQFPPCLLFFAGRLDGELPAKLCFAQSVLIDGIAPMFSIAFLILIFHTWADLRAKSVFEDCMTTGNRWVKWLLLLAPYVAMISWSLASLATALRWPANMRLIEFVYCTNVSDTGGRLRGFVGYFIFGVGIADLVFEAMIGLFLYRHLSGSARDTSTEPYYAGYSSALRIFASLLLQIAPVVLSSLNSLTMPNSLDEKDATQILESMDGLMTFLVFGTQRDILRAWKCWGRRDRPVSEPGLKVIVELDRESVMTMA